MVNKDNPIPENYSVNTVKIEDNFEVDEKIKESTEKRDITKINYEPWHYRCVGVKDAMIIKEKGYCLEEYIEYIMK